MNFLIIGCRHWQNCKAQPKDSAMNAQITPAPAQGDLDAFWMPFTANRQFKANPRLLTRAEGMYYWSADGRQVLDAVAGLWCVNAGHGRREITEAVIAPARDDGIRPNLPNGSPDRVRTRESTSEDCAAGNGSRVLHELGLRVRRHVAEDCHRLPSRSRRGPAHTLHRPRKGLSRRGLWRHVGRRHGQQPQNIWLLHASRRGSPAAYARYRTQRLLARSAALGHASCQ